MEELDDFSPMPFGVHKDKDMEQVPASYLLFLLGQYRGEIKEGKNLTGQRLLVFNYCIDNEQALLQETQES